LEPTASSASGRRWPWAIAIGLFLVIVVNVVFAYVAIHGADTVVSSYTTEPR
jgi:hypothetical protein